MGVSSPLMLPVNQEMAQEESKQGEASLQAEPKDLNMDTHLQLQGFSEVSCLFVCWLKPGFEKKQHCLVMIVGEFEVL